MTHPFASSSALDPVVQSSTGGRGRRHRRRDRSSLVVKRISTFDGMEEIIEVWQALYRSSASHNPYASPDWLMVWARHFVKERELAMLAVWRDGSLIGLAPWYRSQSSHLVPCRLRLLGSGRHVGLTELPQVLTAIGEARSVLRAVINEWSQTPAEWDWLELPMLNDQGWFEPEWLTASVGERGLVQHKTTRAAVELELPTDISALSGQLKRNLLESTHRGRNRLNKTGEAWGITVHSDEKDVRNALPILIRLHSARANVTGRRNHLDLLSVPARRVFLEEALPLMARTGQAQILTLDVLGEAIAAQLVLLAPHATYLGPSGFDPAWWEYSGVTVLQLHAAEAAVERGHRTFNLSVGPSVAKLRWSERIQQHPEFIVCGPRRSSQIAFTAYRVAAAVAEVRRERTRNRTTGGR
jgi:CelD/BcsL family acetyltransferase involved in cellulose biosynthesis